MTPFQCCKTLPFHNLDVSVDAVLEGTAMTREQDNRAQDGSGARRRDQRSTTNHPEESLAPPVARARIWSTPLEHDFGSACFAWFRSPNECDARRSTHRNAVAFSLGIVAPVPAYPAARPPLGPCGPPWSET